MTSLTDLPNDAIDRIVDRMGDDLLRAKVHAKGAGRRAVEDDPNPNQAKMDKAQKEADEAVERAEREYDRSVSRLMATSKPMYAVVFPKARQLYDDWALLQYTKSFNDWALQTMHGAVN